MDFSNYKFRCSSLGHIMTEAKTKSNLEKYNDSYALYLSTLEKYKEVVNKESKTAYNLAVKIGDYKSQYESLKLVIDKINLSDSCKTHLCDLYTVAKYKRTEDIKSKYLEKGLMMEEDAITAYSLHKNQFFSKNPLRLSNEFVEGTNDFIDEEFVYDTKVNWSIFQFNRLKNKKLSKLYFWQLWSYMWIFNRQKAKLIYVLLNTPEHLILIEEKKLLYDFFGTEKQYAEAVKELRHLHIYDDIPAEDKIQEFDIEFDESLIEKVEKRVSDCRIYLNSLNNKKIEDDTDET